MIKDSKDSHDNDTVYHFEQMVIIVAMFKNIPPYACIAHGEHAESVAALLHSGGLSCKVLDKVPFKRAMLEKLVWIRQVDFVGNINGTNAIME